MYPVFINQGFLNAVTKNRGVDVYKSRAVIIIHEIIHITGIGHKDGNLKDSADLTQVILDACVPGYKREDLTIDAH